MTDADPVKAFVDEMRSRGPGYDPGDQEIVGDGRLHRYRAGGDGAGKRNSWYVLHTNGRRPGGAFGSWRTGERFTWRAENGAGTFLTALEKAEVRQDEANRKRREKDERDRAKARAGRIWHRAPLADAGHPYLKRKHVRPNGLRRLGDVLVVPMPVNGELVGLQFIAADGTKRYMRGSAPSGAYFMLGDVEARVIVAEGFATAAAVAEATGMASAVAFSAGNLLAVATSLRKAYPRASIILAADDDAARKDNPGVTYATNAARSVDGAVALPLVDGKRTTAAYDFSDLLVEHGAEAVKVAIEAATKVAPTIAGASSDDERIIRELAEYSEIEYERRREQAQKRLGIRASALDKIVADARKEREQRRRIGSLFPIVEPWDKPVDGAMLLTELARTYERFVVLPKRGEVMLALWTMLTYSHDCFDHSPLLLLRSATKRCGKSTLLGVLGEVTHRPLPAANLTPAVVFRAVEDFRPTLLIDELDSFLDSTEELRGILNSGHQKAAARVLRIEEIGGKRETVAYSTWAPKALAMIGRPPSTLLDRSISLKMQRKLRGRNVEKRRGAVLDAGAIRAKCLRWSMDNQERLSEARPAVPDALNDRQADSWAPLFAIADRVGGTWPEVARETALILCEADTVDLESAEVGEELLRDIRAVFDARAAKREPDLDRISSAELVAALLALDGRPWTEANHGKPIGQHWLGRRLTTFDITSGSIRFTTGGTFKGYYREAFEDAWNRYVPL